MVSLAGSVASVSVQEARVQFEAFKVDFAKVYPAAEEGARFSNFHASLTRVEAHNSKPNQPWQAGINQFSDMSDAEFESEILMDPQDCSATQNSPSVSSSKPHAQDLPAHVDWRTQGVISEVKSQGHCGSCWTFSTAGCLEAHLAIKFDSWRAPRVSEQQLVDCAQAFDNHGCDGGLPSHAFEYVRYAGGLSTEFNYPYTAKDGNCSFVPPEKPLHPFRPTSAGVGVTVPGGSVNLTVGDEDELKFVLATRGPVSIAYQVASDFRDYKHGVYTSTVCKNGKKDVNHAVLAVGYGTDPVTGLDYWLVKNSWDYTFGEEGFFKIEAWKNMCGLADCMAYPDLYGMNAAATETVAV